MEFEDYFSVQIFFIILRETIESAIIVSVLLSFIKQNAIDPITNQLIIDPSIYKKMKFQVWIGALSGLIICIIIGGIFITLFYYIGTDLWSYAERIWEGIFSILSSIIIAMMGLNLLNLIIIYQIIMNQILIYKLMKLMKMNEINENDENNILQIENDSIPVKLNDNNKIKKNSLKEKYFLAFLPFITTLREGLEAVVFIGGIGVNQPSSSFPLAIICGSLLGFLIGYILYKGGNKMSIQYFLIGSTCFLYLVAAGLMSRGFWFLELEQFVRRCGQDTSETGSGPGSYDISNTIWHVNCCNGLKDGGWMIFNALLGWSNTATYGSILSYIGFWIFIINMLNIRNKFEKDGIIEWIPIKWQIKYMKKRININQLFVQEIEEIGDMEMNDNSNEVVNGIRTNDTTPLL
ncbi:high-affinity iron permease [Pichia californica]|uniref:High-affinity iron permease n=1 Tax=Pichia californica TaxID=460514 RepID=A0A9P6WM63_9ASCO|nr:high-affinity iron permease [[Candida] californica]